MEKTKDELTIREEISLDYFASILVEAYLDEKAETNPKFIYPREKDLIKNLIKDSKLRNKLFKMELKDCL